MIVVEGPDGAGKSTLVAKLAQRLGFTAYPLGGKPDTLADVYKYMQMCEERARESHVVQDRVTHISTFVYDVLIDPIRAGAALSRLHHLAAARPLVIYCRPALTNRLREVAETRDESTKKYKSEAHRIWVQANLDHIISLYDSLFHALRFLNVETFTYSYDVTSDADLIKLIELHLKRVREARA